MASNCGRVEVGVRSTSVVVIVVPQISIASALAYLRSGAFEITAHL